jgi:CRP-like cAMP-binding protein
MPMHARPHNSFLMALSRETLSLLKTRLIFREIARQQVLCRSGQAPRFIIFVNEGLISAVIESADGKSAEVGVIGAGGVAGIAALLAGPYNTLTEIVQIEGSAFLIESAQIRDLLRRSPEFQEAITREVLLFGLRAAQIAGCNALHDAEHRLARWLLMVHDKIPINPLPVSQEFLSVLLGITRPSASSIANSLQKKGAIALARERILIRDRKTLERCCCECYAVMARLGSRAQVAAHA